MQFRVGSVYRDVNTKVEFVAVQKSHDGEKNALTFMLVNVDNWIVLEEHQGRLLSSGEISCSTLNAEEYECIARSLREYHTSALDKGHKKSTVKPPGT